MYSFLRAYARKTIIGICDAVSNNLPNHVICRHIKPRQGYA